jgi:PRTRC genetic system protein E
VFKELAPLLRHRSVLFAVGHVEDDQFRVNVIPKKITNGENDALATPVSVTCSIEELDRELPETLFHFVSSHLELKNVLERAKAEKEEASKAARTEAKKRSGSQTTKKDVTGNSNKPASRSCQPDKRSKSLLIWLTRYSIACFGKCLIKSRRSLDADAPWKTCSMPVFHTYFSVRAILLRPFHRS